MIDPATIQVDLLTLIGADVPLKRKASTNGGEWAGPCPWCGGRDRFLVWPHAERPGYLCRQCGKKGDAIQYMRDREGLGFRDAAARLGADVQPRQVPSAARGRPTPPPAPQTPTPEVPSWEAAGLEVVRECEALLWTESGERARAWLAGRGLAEETIREFRLGYQGEDGTRHGLRLDRGIVIPSLAVDGRLWGLQVRRPVGNPKYRQIRGSHHALVGRLAGSSELLLAEGMLDALLAWQEARELVDVATLGSCSVQPADRWLPYLAGYRRILIAFDLDRGGEEGAERWTAWCPRAVRVRLPLPRALRPLDPVAEGEDTDITDFVRAGGDLRAWVATLIAAERAAPECPALAEEEEDGWE